MCQHAWEPGGAHHIPHRLEQIRTAQLTILSICRADPHASSHIITVLHMLSRFMFLQEVGLSHPTMSKRSWDCCSRCCPHMLHENALVCQHDPSRMDHPCSKVFPHCQDMEVLRGFQQSGRLKAHQ